MALNFRPTPGQVLLCDFSRGFIAPEMLKTRPVVVISPQAPHGHRLCTIVPLSTSAPAQQRGCHHLLSADPCPGFSQQHNGVWAKCDMIYTVSFDRLNRLHRKTRQGRQYYIPSVTLQDLQAIMNAVRNHLNLI